MSDDWEWFWAGEGTRDRILRDEIGGLQARLSSASAQTHRLSSQLATLSGSIESRLSALSRAFDAYVELGDVREELTAYAQSAAVRRDVIDAVEAMADGRPATPVDARGLDYWLPHALNAVRALVEGRDAAGDLEQARELSTETDLFVVATAGALGHGTTVADLLAGVLTADESLTAHQQSVWRAVAAGAYGSRLPEALAATWRPQLDREPTAGWTSWVTAHGPTPSAGIAWLRTAVVDPANQPVPPASPPAGASPAGASPAGAPVGGLRGVVTELIQRGLPDEQDLLRRSKELRALIEHPNTARSNGDPDAKPPTVVSEVRRALLEATTDDSVRATLRSWVAPALLSVVDELATSAAAVPPAQESLRGHGGLVVVTAAGADAAALQAAQERLTSAYQVPRTRLLAWSIATGVAAVLTLGFGVAGSGWAWLFALVLVAGVIGTALQVAFRRRTRRTGAEALAALQRDVTETRARLAEQDKRQTVLQVQLDGEAAELRDRLTAELDASHQPVAASQG